MALNRFKSKIITLLNRGQLKIQEQLQNRIFFISPHMPLKRKTCNRYFYRSAIKDGDPEAKVVQVET